MHCVNKQGNPINCWHFGLDKVSSFPCGFAPFFPLWQKTAKQNMRATHIVLVLFWVLCIYTPALFCANVQYDHRALVIDGKRRVLISGSIHYPRSTPEVFFSLCVCVCDFCVVFELRKEMLQMWPDLIRKSKDGGLDVIETYVFWNIHEPVRGEVMIVLFSFILFYFNFAFFYGFQYQHCIC